ncbi:MAG: hypothetical protein ACKV22_16100 [Bryobacteraceae bacterium]
MHDDLVMAVAVAAWFSVRQHAYLLHDVHDAIDAVLIRRGAIALPWGVLLARTLVPGLPAGVRMRAWGKRGQPDLRSFF